MKKKLIFIAVFACLNSALFAQLSIRENDATVERLSARPVKGDMALTFAVGIWQDNLSSDPNDTLDEGLPFMNRLFTGDLLTYKYYLRDNLAFRGGIRLYRNAKKATGEEADSSLIYPFPVGIAEAKRSEVDRDFILAGGLEKHFSKSNIFDVYAAADILLGFGLIKTVDNVEFSNGDFQNLKAVSRPFKAGGELLTGFNVFIAHLPVSLGMEYGLSFIWARGKGKTKVTEEGSIAGVGDYDLEYVTEDDDFLGLNAAFPGVGGFQFDKLKKSEFNMNTNQSVRITLNIYFSKDDKTAPETVPVGTQF